MFDEEHGNVFAVVSLLKHHRSVVSGFVAS